MHTGSHAEQKNPRTLYVTYVCDAFVRACGTCRHSFATHPSVKPKRREGLQFLISVTHNTQQQRQTNYTVCISDSKRNLSMMIGKFTQETKVIPRINDVILGRGNGIAAWPGNVAFRHIVWSHRTDYQRAHRHGKNKFAVQVVEEVYNLNPPGRFIECSLEGNYHAISFQKAIEKASQALRERKSSIPAGYNPKVLAAMKKKATVDGKKLAKPREKIINDQHKPKGALNSNNSDVKETMKISTASTKVIKLTEPASTKIMALAKMKNDQEQTKAVKKVETPEKLNFAKVTDSPSKPKVVKKKSAVKTSKLAFSKIAMIKDTESKSAATHPTMPRLVGTLPILPKPVATTTNKPERAATLAQRPKSAATRPSKPKHASKLSYKSKSAATRPNKGTLVTTLPKTKAATLQNKPKTEEISTPASANTTSPRATTNMDSLATNVPGGFNDAMTFNLITERTGLPLMPEQQQVAPLIPSPAAELPLLFPPHLKAFFSSSSLLDCTNFQPAIFPSPIEFHNSSDFEGGFFFNLPPTAFGTRDSFPPPPLFESSPSLFIDDESIDIDSIFMEFDLVDSFNNSFAVQRNKPW